MPAPARRIPTLVFICAILSLVACEAADATPTPRPTRTPRVDTPTSTATPEPSETPTPLPTDTPTSAPTSARIAQAVPVARDPMLPTFGPFPPKAIPNRPANINPLTGLAADPAALQRRPIVARIGNDEKVHESLWHAGLNAADLVFEELVDQLGSQYANTRFSAVYLSNDPPLIGPIRSGRIINFQIVPMLEGALAHAGASNATRWLFSQTPMTNLDEYFNMSAYCYNMTHGYQGRLYTTGPRLRQWMEQKGLNKAVPLYGFSFSDSAPTGGQPNKSVGITRAPWPRWSVLEWRYDANSGRYLRYATGEPHLDNTYPVTAKWGNGADCVTGRVVHVTQSTTIAPQGAKVVPGTFVEIKGTVRNDNTIDATEIEVKASAPSGKYSEPSGFVQSLPKGSLIGDWVVNPELHTQVSTANVVVLYARHEKTNIIEDSNNAVSVHITLTGNGDAIFFRDGVMTRGKWQRDIEQEFFEFTSASGKRYDLKPGNTWFEIVPIGYTLDLK